MNSKVAYRPGIHAVAVFAAAFTLPLLYVGGSVTTYRVGMAVPDWPTTFQENMFRYDFWNAPFGVQVEHTHRLYGAAVGMASIVLAGCLLAFDPRRWMKAMGVLALAAVIGQGVLGGLRVTRVSTLLAAVHGCTGQAFFGLLVALCVFTGRDWNAATGRAADPDRLRGRCTLALILVYAQILVGGWLRHFATPAALGLHSALAAGVLAYAAWLALTIHARRAAAPRLVGPSRVLIVAVAAQVALGIVSLVLLWPLDGTARPVPMLQAVIRTSHQTNAAVLFAASIVLTLRSFRHLAGTADTAAARPGDRPVGRPEAVALDWEAVA
jgi:cytochrome c oxidase assembly protein subunit 15